MPVSPCPLCRSRHTEPAACAAERRYLRCGTCQLIFMHPDDRIPLQDERRHYATHRNDPNDPRYRAFLSRVSRPLARVLLPHAVGLDYGCGPGPTLSVMLREMGFTVREYDPCFFDDPLALQRSYDFITCTEVVEHFHQPAHQFARLDGLLRPGGWLAIMTQWTDGTADLSNWWYLRDPTHVCFYGRPTLTWIARQHDWRVWFAAENVSLMQQRAVPQQPGPTRQDLLPNHNEFGSVATAMLARAYPT